MLFWWQSLFWMERSSLKKILENKLEQFFCMFSMGSQPVFLCSIGLRVRQHAVRGHSNNTCHFFGNFIFLLFVAVIMVLEIFSESYPHQVKLNSWSLPVHISYNATFWANTIKFVLQHIHIIVIQSNSVVTNSSGPSKYVR